MDSIATTIDRELREVLVPIAMQWGIPIDEPVLERLRVYASELISWNERVNLTRIVTPHDIVIRHFLDSLACARAWETPPVSLADIGTGAGFPGIPLKLIWPTTRLMLSDSVGKKTAFLQHVVGSLGIEDVEVVTARAEDLGRAPAHREQYEGVVARAVAALNVLSEYCLPLCSVGGRFVAPKGGDGADELRLARRAIGQVGGVPRNVLPVVLPEIEPRTLIVIDKVRPTPREFPRAAGVPTKRPL